MKTLRVLEITLDVALLGILLGVSYAFHVERERLQAALAAAERDRDIATQMVGLTIADDPLVQPIPWSTTGKSYATSILKEYDTAARQVAEHEGVTFISLWDALTSADLADGLHPNAAGYEKMYLKIHAALRPLLS